MTSDNTDMPLPELCGYKGCTLLVEDGHLLCNDHIALTRTDNTEKDMWPLGEPILKPRSTKLSCTLAEIDIIFIFYEVEGTEEPQHDYLFGGELVTHEETIIYLANKHKVPPMDINITGVLK